MMGVGFWWCVQRARSFVFAWGESKYWQASEAAQEADVTSEGLCHVRESVSYVKASRSHRGASWETVRQSSRMRHELAACFEASGGVRRTVDH